MDCIENEGQLSIHLCNFQEQTEEEFQSNSKDEPPSSSKEQQRIVCD